MHIETRKDPLTTVFVYGTLRKGGKTERLRGWRMFNIGYFPGVIKDEVGEITIERLQVTKEELANLDRYEGVPHLYRRETVEVGGEKGEMYIYNRTTEGKEIIKTGDWFNR